MPGTSLLSKGDGVPQGFSRPMQDCTYKFPEDMG